MRDVADFLHDNKPGSALFAGELGARGDGREQDIYRSENLDRRQIARTSVSDCNLDVARLVGRHHRRG